MAIIVHRIGIKAPLEKIYAALTKPDQLAAWLTKSIKAPSPGGTVATGQILEMQFKTEERTFEIKDLIENRLVHWACKVGRFEWVGTEVTFSLNRTGDESIVIFRHSEWAEAGEYFAHCSTKWVIHLTSLKSFVESGKGMPCPQDWPVSSWG